MPRTKPTTLKPKLRFPAFRDQPGWECMKLGSFATFQKGQGLPKSAISNEGEFECIHYGQLFTEYPEVIDTIISRTDTDEANVRSIANDVLMPTSDVTPSGLAKACCIDQDDVILGGDILAIRADKKKVNGHFLARQIRQRERDVLRLVSGTTVFHLYASALEKLQVCIPAPAEQRAIADCLGSVDAWLAAAGRKLAALRDHKRGLMQQLFPQPGQSQPQQRFPEFRKAGKWKAKKLGRVCEVLNNRRIPITSSDRKPGPYPYYGASGIVDWVDEYIFDERLVLVGEDGAKWQAFESTAFIAEGKYWVNNHAHVLKGTEVVDVFLEAYLTMADVGPFVTGAAPPKLTLAQLKLIPIPLPPTKDEQQKIAACLTTLDTQITAQAAQIESLKTHKHGLMQQLFPSPPE